MRKIVVSEFVSLDGVIEAPMWTFPYWNDDIATFKADEQEGIDAMLLGRVTYEGFAASWPERGEEDGAPWFNNTRKYCVTNTLDSLSWNNSEAIGGDVVARIKALKQGDGGDLLVYGSGKLLQTLVQHDLVDRYHLLIYPVVLGTGQKLFEDGTEAKLKLVEAKTFSSGVTALIYEPAR